MRKIIPVLLVLVVAGVAFAEGATPTGDTVPSWVFNLASGIASVVILALVAACLALWSKLSKKSALTGEQATQLKDLHEWHDNRDDDGVLKWMVPRVWVELLHQLIQGQKVLTDMIRRLVDQNDGITDDLRQQLKDRLSLHDKQQNKMLKVALRVQRAVEALAGLETPEIEDDLVDDEET